MHYAFRFAACFSLAALLMLPGCGLQTTMRGQYYLNLKKYEEGIADFNERLRETPHDAQSHYYVGRYHLALGRTAQALPELAKAVDFAPDRPDYWFWLGVAHGVRGEAEAEGQCYARALDVDPEHLQSLIYLGHNRLEAGAMDEALGFYDRSINIWPEAPEPLFNRAVILDRKGSAPEAVEAYKAYLELYPSGALALRAADALNALGNFDYRNHLLGKRRVTLERIEFEPGGAKLAYDSLPNLKVVGAILENNAKLTLQVLAYQEGDAGLAKARALAVREHILQTYPRLDPGRIQASWFAVPESVRAGKKTYNRPQALHLFAVEGD